MNRKLYIKWLLRQWLPLIFIFGAIMLLAYFVPSLAGAIYPYQTAEEYFGYSSYDFTQTLFYTEIGEVNAGKLRHHGRHSHAVLRLLLSFR